MKFPAVFINHGGGPLPLLGRQPHIVTHMKNVVEKYLPPEPPKAIVVFSAHWESDTIRITSSNNPSMLFDYYGFPPETYEYDYPAPGDPELATRIQLLLTDNDIPSQLDEERGFDHGVFIPLMTMYPKANVPVVCVSLHSSLDANLHVQIGKALAPLLDDNVLILGSGYTFHNLKLLFNPTPASMKASTEFNDWLKTAITSSDSIGMLESLQNWETLAPSARVAHPREEHLLPLLMCAGTGGVPELIFDMNATDTEPAISSYLFRQDYNNDEL